MKIYLKFDLYLNLITNRILNYVTNDDILKIWMKTLYFKIWKTEIIKEKLSTILILYCEWLNIYTKIYKNI